MDEHLMDAMDEEAALPRTPKRAQEGLGGADGRTTPPKLSRLEEDDDTSEPTNRDLMKFLKVMQDSQSIALKQISNRIGEAEIRIAKVEEATTARLNSVEAKLEHLELGDGADREARTKIAELEETIKNMDKLFKQFQAQAHAARTSAGSSSSTMNRADECLVIIGGFKKETPRGQLEEVWAKQMLKEIEKHIDLRTYEVFCPYMLSSVLFARCPDSASARAFVALIRRLNLVVRLKGVDYNIWGTLQKPKEVKARNRRLMRLVGYLKDFLGPEVQQNENYKCVCWSSGTIIMNDTRICKVVHTGANNFELTFCDEWYDNRTFRSGASAIEEGARKLMKDIADAEL